MHIPFYRNKVRAKQEEQRKSMIQRTIRIAQFAKKLSRFEKRCRDRKQIMAAEAKRYRKLRHIAELSGYISRRPCVGTIFDFSQDVPRQDLSQQFRGKFRVIYNDSEFMRCTEKQKSQ